MPRRAWLLTAALTILALVGTVMGWRAFWFLTDDAFIAFRYVGNSQMGHGYTWNAPPFLPVEGYTSFLWVWLLDMVWTLTGVEPPRSSNLLSLGCALGSVCLTALLAVGAWMRSRPPVPPALGVGLALALLVSNTTFLTWSSSGLETALFDLLLLGWVAACLGAPRGRGWIVAAAGAAALLELCRPDGLLFACSTALLPFALWWGSRRGVRALARDLVRLAPLLLIPGHLLWRWGFYGEWLPNTYYAKVVEPWPEAGLRYLLSFVLEYALWIPALLLLIVPLRRLWSRERRSSSGWEPTGLRALAVVVVSLVAHLGYYLLVVGGDHFEYRVLAHLPPLVALVFVAALFALHLRWLPFTVAGLLLLAAGSLIPWASWWHGRAFTTRGETHMLVQPLAPRLPGPLAAYALPWDALQRWMVDRYVCIRRQEHLVFWQFQTSYLPSREVGALAFEGVDNPVITSPTVGVLGWVYPHAAVIDILGLNDWVAARNPMTHDRDRVMAHDREPPAGYMGEFQPVLYVREGKLHPEERSEPLTDAHVRDIEARWRAIVDDY